SARRVSPSPRATRSLSSNSTAGGPEPERTERGAGLEPTEPGNGPDRPERSAGAARSGGRVVIDEPAPGIARLTISNPGKRGALDHPILDAFAQQLPQLDARCVVITGEDAIFSAGYDIGDLPDSVFADEAEKLIAHPFAAAID